MKQLFVLFVFCSLIPFSSEATHVMGADIAWKSLGNDSFEIIVHAYRDCNGVQLSGSGLSYWTAADTCASSPVSVTPNVCCGTDITPVCNKSCDRCQSSSCSFAYGIEDWTITATVYLEAPCCNYTIAWEESSRSSNITTGAANYDFYEEVHLNRCIRPGDNSPYFKEPPISLFCENQCVVYNMGAIDNDTNAYGDHDSLSYSFGYPQSAAGRNIYYAYPYTNDAPVIFAGNSKDQAFIPPTCYGFHIDSITGDVLFKAVKPDVSPLVVVVTEYRKDSAGISRQIGYIERDVEIEILNCPANTPPIIASLNNNNSFSYKLCADQKTCFSFEAFNIDTADSTHLSWLEPGNMKGASFTISADKKNAKWQIGTFCWSPTDSDISARPYNFNLNAIDNVCPVPGRTSRIISVYVLPAAPIVNYSASLPKCGYVNFTASTSSKSSSKISSYVWSGYGAIGEKPLLIADSSGSYQYTKAGTYPYALIITASGGCSVTYKDSIKILAFIGITLPKDTGVCTNSTLAIKAHVLNINAAFKITWNTGSTDSVIKPLITQDVKFSVQIRDSLGCINMDTISIKALPVPTANAGATQSICKGDSVTIGAPPVATVYTQVLPNLQQIKKWN